MRPEILFSLFAPLTDINGVGPRLGKLMERLCGPHQVDLLWHLPSGLIDRRFTPKVAEAPPGVVATLDVHIERHLPSINKRLPYKVICSDDSGRITLVFFHAREDYLRRSLPEGERRLISGRIEHYGKELQMPHPDRIGRLDERAAIETVEALYPLTAGLTTRPLAKAIGNVLEKLPDLPEWQDPAFLAGQAWPSWRDAVHCAHAPQDVTEIDPGHPARRRLAYDELLANQLALALVRHNMRRGKGRSIAGDGSLRAAALGAIEFELTGAQIRAAEEIAADMESGSRMLRLLQGDVGSGKTVVALLAMLNAVETGRQAVLMAPTEVLARQHCQTLGPLTDALGLSLRLLTGREKGKNRQSILDDLASGAANIAVGTHALFQEGVVFSDLALAVIDEQHRFGVHQRLTLAGKGQMVDVMVMTATPIPRTLMLTAYGDMDVSRLDEKPPGRRAVDTRLLSVERLDDVVRGLQRVISDGARVYWVCPLVADSETSDLAAAEERHVHLSRIFKDRCALMHGQMKGKEKDAAMMAFAKGEVDILVATTVIEVGLDVAEATVMVVEHAERFGLAQLHQLRGRIGRGTQESHCLLLYTPPLSDMAKKRLQILRATEDGFRIAEEDLKLRGAGELLGTRQSGLPEFRLADMIVHGDLLAAARDDAALIMAADPDLRGKRGPALRCLLYLFEREAAVRFLRSG